MTKKIKYIGLDVHKNSITVAIANEGSDQEVRNYGKNQNNAIAIDKTTRKLISDGSKLGFVYEAGPCGYTSYWHH